MSRDNEKALNAGLGRLEQKNQLHVCIHLRIFVRADKW